MTSQASRTTEGRGRLYDSVVDTIFTMHRVPAQ